mgnify:FL=1
MRKTESQKIALCGMLGALSVVLLLLGSALQIGTYAAPMLAAFLLIPVLEEYGYKRTAWVLANTLHELKWDGRFGHANKQWAERACIPKDINHNSDFAVRSHPAVLDGFVSLYRKAVQALNLFGAEHCVGDRAEQDFTGKVLVLSPEALQEQYWGQDYQLLYARSGFGCEPHSSGRAV